MYFTHLRVSMFDALNYEKSSNVKYCSNFNVLRFVIEMTIVDMSDSLTYNNKLFDVQCYV